MLQLKLITEAPETRMWRRTWGRSHLAVGRTKQLVNMACKAQEAPDRKVLSLAINNVTMEVLHLKRLHIDKFKTCAKFVQATMTIHSH